MGDIPYENPYPSPAFESALMLAWEKYAKTLPRQPIEGFQIAYAAFRKKWKQEHGLEPPDPEPEPEPSEAG